MTDGGGFGRGGRGSFLLEALKTPARRPGFEPTSISDTCPSNNVPSQPIKPFGRGNLAKLLVQQKDDTIVPPPSSMVTASRILPTTTTESLASSQPPRQIGFGRGVRQLTSLLQNVQVSSSSSSVHEMDRPRPIENQSQMRPVTTPGSNMHGTVGNRNGRVSSSSLNVHEMNRPRPIENQSQMRPATTPGLKMHGTVGNTIPLSANYINVHFTPNKGIFEYHVHFDPEVDGNNVRFGLVNQCKPIIGEVKIFDGTKLILPKRLPNEITTINGVHRDSGNPVNIIIKFTGQKNIGSCTQVFNIILKRIMTLLDFQKMGKRDCFDPKGAVHIPQHKLDIWPGYVTAIQEFEGGLMLCIDVSHRVMRTQTAWEVLSELSARNPKTLREAASAVLIGSTVLTRYNNKTHRIDDIDWSMNPLSTFTTSSGQEISFVEYYRNSYHIEIRDYGQPMLLHRAKRKERDAKDLTKLICLVPEICHMTGLTDDMRKDFRVMKDVAVFTRLNPNQRTDSLRKYIKNVQSSEECLKLLQNWGISLDNDVLGISGRVLPSETIYLQGSQFKANREADWSREVGQSPMLCSVNLLNWAIVFIKRDSQRTMEFIKMIRRLGDNLGMTIAQPKILELRDEKTENFLRSIRDAINPEVQLVVIISPTIREDRYSAIKRLCCCDKPVASQVINSKTIGNPNKLRSITLKIAMQINCKLGGQLWAVGIPKENLMVVGIDVFHDKKKNSVGAFVASMNSTLTRWYSRVCIHAQNQELIDGLKPCLIAALRKYHEINHILPHHIIVFRDGVGDSQLDMVGQYEVEQLSHCFSSFGEYEPKLSVIVVQKRINTRFFYKESPRNMSNPPPGTILDNTITKKSCYDFYLVSQHVRQGTVSPTHYVVVHDTSSDSPDFMQKLSYKLTHLYYNWAGTVRVPAPCQYAHKLAYLVGQSIQKSIHPELCDRLFFL